jgi:hypothetical protein
LPPEVPAGENPPPGAIFYYHLKDRPQGEVKLEIVDGRGELVRTYSSNDKPWKPSTPPAFPEYWFQPEERIETTMGTHRIVWDLRYAPPDPGSEYTMSTAFGRNTAREPQGPLAMPGSYQVRLTANGKTYSQPLKLVMDPRILIPKTDLETQFALQMKIQKSLIDCNRALEEIARYRLSTNASATTPEKLKGLEEIEPAAGRGGRAAAEKPTLSGLRGSLTQLAVQLDAADAAPTSQQTAATDQTLAQLGPLLKAWEALKK